MQIILENKGEMNDGNSFTHRQREYCILKWSDNGFAWWENLASNYMLIYIIPRELH